MSTKKKEIALIIKNALILFAITAFAGFSLSIVNSLTAAPIAAQKIIQRDKALAEVLPDSGFEEVEIQNPDRYEMLKSVFAAKDKDGNFAGYAFMLVSKGYGGNITLVTGIDKEDLVQGIDIVSHSETPGLGANADNEQFKSRLKGKMAQNLIVVKGNNEGQNVDAMSGATITTQAVITAVNEAISYYQTELKGGK